MMLLLLAAAMSRVAADADLPTFDNTCWDDDPLTLCPTTTAANNRYAALAMPGGHQPKGDLADPSCAESERKVDKVLNLRSNASRCFEALRKRKAIDDAEAPTIKCERTAMLAHTWWDGPMVRVVALFLRSFKATQNPSCAKLVVWTPVKGSERATERGRELVEAVEAMAGAPVVFEVLRTQQMARGTPFEEYVNRAILPHDWSTDKPGDKKEGTRHFSDFFQLFVLYLYGGVYFDADQVLLRDMWPLYGMHFVYQWSFDQQKFNNAVQGLRKGHGLKIVRHGGKLERKGCCRGWGNAIWSAKIMRMSGTATYALPCSAWDPFWLRMDGHISGEMSRPSIKWPEPASRNWLFQSLHADYGEWYAGAFGIHWHGGAGGPHGGGDAQAIWEPKVRAGSYFDHWERLYSNEGLAPPPATPAAAPGAAVRARR